LTVNQPFVSAIVLAGTSLADAKVSDTAQHSTTKQKPRLFIVATRKSGSGDERKEK
jgi:hypothetical protein